MIVNGVDFGTEPHSHGRRLVTRSRKHSQRDWNAVDIYPNFVYTRFSLWFSINCSGYWQYPKAGTFWFSDSQDVIKYYFDIDEINQFSVSTVSSVS